MAESTKNSDNNLFKIYSTPSNEHLVFAETLRDWRDPLLQGYDPIPVPLCPRCAICKCQSLKDFRNISSSSIHHRDHGHHHKHDPSCPDFRHQHERAKTPIHQRTITKFKRRAISHDPSITVLNTSSSSSSIIKSKSAEHSPLIHSMERKKLSSKIPVRVSTPISNYSPSSLLSSITKIQSSNKKTKIPRLIFTPSLSSSTKTTDDLYEIDSLNDDADRTSQIISDNETTSLNENRNIKTNHNQLNNMDEQILIKKKKKNKHNISISDKRQRRYRYKEGRHSKSKSTSNDLSTSSSLSSSSSQSLSPLRKKSHSTNRRSSNCQTLSSSSSSNTSEKLQSKQYSQIHQHSGLVSTNQSNHLSPQSPSSSSSIYLIQVTNTNNQTNSFGLTKTIPYVWKNRNINNIEDEENNIYPKFSIEQIPPIINNKKRSLPISSRNIILQRGQIDYWQNFETLPDSILTSSCQNSTGSASNLLYSSTLLQQNKNHKNSHGNIISITTTKRYQPSLLNKTKDIQWNIEGNGKQFRYSKTKWHSDHHLHKHNRLRKKYQKQTLSDNHTDTGSSSEQNNHSAPLIFHQKNSTNLLNKTHEVLEKSSMNINSKQIDSIVPDYTSSHRNKTKASLSIIPNEKTNHSSSTPSSKPVHISKSKQISYASTDEDVDELNSHYFEDIDRSITKIEDYREKLNTRLLSSNNEQNINQINTTYRSRILSTEYSQITIDSGVDIGSEQKFYQQNTTLTIDEQPSEQITDHNDLFILSDDSLIEKESKLSNKQFVINQSIIEKSEPTIISINNIQHEINNSTKNNLYKTYELEIISDEDEDNDLIKYNSNELIITSEKPLLINHSSIIPSQFQFKLPTFGEWIDRAFTTFLSDTNQHQSESILSSRSSSIVSMHTSQSTINTSSSSQIITVLDNLNLQNISKNDNIDLPQTQIFTYDEEQDDEHSFNEVISDKRRMLNYDDDNNNDDDDDDDTIPNKIPTINTNDLPSYIVYEKFQYSSNSHDSLDQSDHHIDTTTSSIDDLTKTNQFLTSTFYSKDSALGLSDDNLNYLQTNQLIIFDDDNNNNNNNNNQEYISSLFQDNIVDNIEIPFNANTNVNIETMQKNDTMISINNEIQLNENENDVERTISTNSSEHLIPKEKQT
ncbi:unnamed protein product, partial [Rotaria sp. Silwood2]